VWMRVRVLYFGVLKDVMGRGRAEMELEDGASVTELLEIHRGMAGAGVWDSIAVAVNQEYARAGDLLKDGDEVALLPPVSGGCLVLAGWESIPQGLKPLNSAVGRGQG
jgi:molybdopterin converting factor subunit 1